MIIKNNSYQGQKIVRKDSMELTLLSKDGYKYLNDYLKQKDNYIATLINEEPNIKITKHSYRSIFLNN